MQLLLDIGRWIAAFLILAVMLGLPLSASAASERQLKLEAAFLYNFLNYITWPGKNGPDSLHEATICVFGQDPLRPYLEYVSNKREEERTLHVRSVGLSDSWNGCHILFIRSVMDPSIYRRINDAYAQWVLVVSETRGFVEQGGMIGLQPQGQKMAIEINHRLLKQYRFQVSSRLLTLARRVKR